MNKPTNIKVAIVSTGIILSFIFAFVYPVQPKETQAQFGGVTFNIKLKDLAKKAEDFKKKYGKWGDLAFQTLKKRYLIQIQNDLVNWVQGNGKPRFITNPKKFIKNEIKFATISTIDKFFLEQGSDICSPFKANVQFLVNRTKLLQEEQLRCNWTDVKKNMEAFANNFEDGGWTAWLKLHETRNTLPGTYLASTQLIGAEAALAGNTAIAKITAGKGFLDSKKCTKIEIPFYKIFFSEDTPYGGVHEVDLGNKLLAMRCEIN